MRNMFHVFFEVPPPCISYLGPNLKICERVPSNGPANEQDHPPSLVNVPEISEVVPTGPLFVMATFLSPLGILYQT